MDIHCEIDKKSRRREGILGASIARLVISLGIAFVSTCAAVVVATVTYATMGRSGLQLLLLLSFLYCGLIFLITRNSWTGVGSIDFAMARDRVILMFLALGIAGLVERSFFAKSQISPHANTMRILLMVLAILSVCSFARGLFEAIQSEKNNQITDTQRGDERRHDESCDDPQSGQRPAKQNAESRIFIAIACVLNSLVWTWLIFYYSYLCPSLLSQSLLVMVSLGVFLASCWFHCVVLLRR